VSEREQHSPVIAAVVAGGAARAAADPRFRNKAVPDWAVELEAARLLRMSSPGAPVAKRLMRYWDCVLIRGIVLNHVFMDGAQGRKNTQRGHFDVYTGPSKDYKDGVEPMRTDRLDSAGPGRTVNDVVAARVGYVVRIWKINEVRHDEPGRTIRVAIWVEILGVPTEEEIEEAERLSGRKVPRVENPENRLSGQHAQGGPGRANAQAQPATPARTSPAQAPANVAQRAATPPRHAMSEEDRIALEAGERLEREAKAAPAPPAPVPSPVPPVATPETEAAAAPPAPPVSDDGIPLGAPGVPNLAPVARWPDHVDPTDPPLPSELAKIATHAQRLTNGDSPRDGESKSAAHEREAHQLVEALLCYSLWDPEHDNGKHRDGTPKPKGALTFDLVRSRYHARQVIDHLTRQPTPPKVEALT
jgi:hypothetical protein